MGHCGKTVPSLSIWITYLLPHRPLPSVSREPSQLHGVSRWELVESMSAFPSTFEFSLYQYIDTRAPDSLKYQDFSVDQALFETSSSTSQYLLIEKYWTVLHKTLYNSCSWGSPKDSPVMCSVSFNKWITFI